MTAYAARTDTNQAAIVEELRACGAIVEITHRAGNGFPDLVVGWHGCAYLVEVKAPGKWNDLTPKEREFKARWHGTGCYVVIESVQDFLDHVDRCCLGLA